jgi:hypothetical protein
MTQTPLPGGESVLIGLAMRGWFMRTGLGLLAFAGLTALTACGGGSSTASVPADIPANFNSILSGLKSAVTETQNDLGGEQNDARIGPSNEAGTCVNLVANIDYDVTTIIVHDRQNVIDEVNNLKTAVAGVRQDVANWQSDVQAIVNQGVPSPSGESSAISSAKTQIQLALSTANGDIDQANAYVDQAFGTANAMTSGACSGHGPEPGKIGHLS